MSKNKNQGTRYERARANRHNAAGLPSDRLAEGGSGDDGDVWIVAPPGHDDADVGWIDEAKARANLNPHRTLHKALAKAGHQRVLLSHKRLTRKEGNHRRTPDGEPEVVVMHPRTAEILLLCHEWLRSIAPQAVDRLWRDIE